MITYWLTLFMFSLFAMIEPRRNYSTTGYISNSFTFLWILVFVYLVWLIGLRHEVGGDWGAYLRYFQVLGNQTFNEIFDFRQDPSYAILNWYSSKNGLSIYFVNTVSAIFFSYGLIRFCRALPRPFLALAASFPYLVIVVAMGYTRQSIAIGLGMLALVALTQRKLYKFFALILFAATFHKTALLLLGILFLATQKNRLVIFIFIGLFFALLAQSYLFESYSNLLKYYVIQEYKSEGALIRILMLTIPSLLLLIWPHRFDMHKLEKSLWKWIALASLIFLLLLIVTDLSTALDRMALYFLPIHIVVFSYLPEIFRKNSGINQILVFMCIAYFFLIQFVWLFFASFSHYWLPYKTGLFLE